MLAQWQNKEIHVVGISGVEGSSLALFLIAQGCRNIIGHDFSVKKDFVKNYAYYHQGLSKQAIDKQIEIISRKIRRLNYKNDYLKNIGRAEMIFAPSSWFRYEINRPLLPFSRRKNFLNWYNLLLKYYAGTVIGVTGTAGKGTTTHLIFKILQAAKKSAWLIGESWQMIPFEQIFKADKNSLVVAEISHRTLTFAKNVKTSPSIAVITNITKNHLDDCGGSFAKYIKLKKELAAYQTKEEVLFLNSDNPQTIKLKKYGLAKKIMYSAKNQGSRFINNPNIFGPHLRADAVAAVKVASYLKIGRSAIISGLKSFKAREGRMEPVGRFNNITFINDGASTRPEATMAAVASFPGHKVHLILEGYRFKPDLKQFKKLVRTIREHRVKTVAVSGRIAQFIAPLFKKTRARVYLTKNLETSFVKATGLAKAGEVILLSPANESFGEFKDYRQRVAKFNQLVKKYGHGQKKIN